MGAISAEAFFSRYYEEARARFLQAAEAAGAALDTKPHPLTGPKGEALSTDLAWLGAADAKRVLVTISATHGVEGFCGSGAQVGWLESGLHRERPAGTAHLMIHAINPHGFAWLRRVTEDNVDLNRNFVDHDAPYPENAGYEELAGALCPTEWDDDTIAETQKTLDAYAEKHGRTALQSAISGGQYRHANGIFFGGHRPTWSRTVLEEILHTRLARAKRVAVVDFHTGLGPHGHGERICVHPPGSASLARAAEWYRGDITSPALGTSSSVELHGSNEVGMEKALAGRDLTAIALEYGTIPTPEVRVAIRADNWLHHHGDPGSAKGKAIKAQIRAAFYPGTREWKELVWERAVETLTMAKKGLSGT
jgi:hypothetical protein